MKRFFHLMIVALAATALLTGCQKYDDTQIRQEIKALGDRVAALEAWCSSSQEAIDNVAKLKKAVEEMKSVESVEAFDEDGDTGYVIKFTDGQSIKLYNGKAGDTFFGKVEIGTEYVTFTLADGSSFTVRRVKPATIGFDSYETKVIARRDTVWTVMDPSFTKSAFAAFTAELMTEDGTSTAIATKGAADDATWKIEAIAPDFGEDGKLTRPAGVVVTKTPQAGGKGVLKVALVNNEGREETSSLVVDIAPNYLAFEAVEAGATVSMEIVGEVDAPSLEYSTNKLDWTVYDFSNPQTITLENVGDKVYWRNTGKSDTFSPFDNYNYIHFDLGSKKIAAQGNIMSLLDSECEMTEIPQNATFNKLFLEDSTLISAPELPATKLSPGCYRQLFDCCYSLGTSPELPAMELETLCYVFMFYNCTSLKEAPVLPATKLEEGCYEWMFAGCTSLKEAPELLASKLTKECYCQMFTGCTSLKAAPELNATKLHESCYANMFENCTALEIAPELPATDMKEGCYGLMFSGCTSLKEAPELPATTLADYCYYEMFSNCTSLKEAPVLPATKLAYACCYRMFAGCSSLEEVPELRATKMALICYNLMFSNCSSLKNAPELPAAYLAPGCYDSMFANCTALERAPELPATTLADFCYAEMFLNCISLTEAPKLPARELVDECYLGMFHGCTNLEYIKVGFDDWGISSTTEDWLLNVAPEGTFECPEGLAIQYGDNFIPNGWSVNGTAPVAMKSCAAPATKFINHSIRKTLAPKNPEIQGRLVEHEMITL